MFKFYSLIFHLDHRWVQCCSTCWWEFSKICRNSSVCVWLLIHFELPLFEKFCQCFNFFCALRVERVKIQRTLRQMFAITPLHRWYWLINSLNWPIEKLIFPRKWFWASCGENVLTILISLYPHIWGRMVAIWEKKIARAWSALRETGVINATTLPHLKTARFLS